MKKAGFIKFVAGFMLGALIFGGTAALATGIMAQPKTAAVIIDGQSVDLNGYIIEGAHYFQLRDMSEKLTPGGKDFSVIWDGGNNGVLIDTRRGYDPDETLPTPGAIQETAMTMDEMKMELVRLTNAERVRAGLTELAILPELMDCAQLKAEDMIANRYFGHTSPIYGSANDMIGALVPGYRGACENLDIGGTNPADVVAGWAGSAEHSKNLLDSRVTHIGVGIAVNNSGTLIWVQQLMRK